MSKLFEEKDELLHEVLKHCKTEEERKSIIELYNWYKLEKANYKKGK